MKKLFIGVLAALLAFSNPAFARGGHGGSRVSHGGEQHTISHGGSYAKGGGSSHKGGTYKDGRTGNRYGRHK